MEQYYMERNGLLQERAKIDIKGLRAYWGEIYQYFKSKGYFQLAEFGVCRGNAAIPLKLSPSPTQYFLLHTGKTKIWPIEDNLLKYSEDEIFTLIEIYYDSIERCEWKENEDGEWDWERDTITPKSEFCTYVNNILRFYGNGYCLEPSRGFIMLVPNEALQHQLNAIVPCITNEVFEQLSSATKDFYRFDATLERKKKAIATLADILEPLRNDLKDILNEECSIAKNDHDKLIFDIVNNFNVRHNNKKQYKEYSVGIWYDWMMQYYTSVIIAYYRLREKKVDAEIEEMF